MSTTSLTSLKVGDPESPDFADFGHFPPFFFGHAGNIHSWNRDPGGCCLKTAAFLPFFFLVSMRRSCGCNFWLRFANSCGWKGQIRMQEFLRESLWIASWKRFSTFCVWHWRFLEQGAFRWKPQAIWELPFFFSRKTFRRRVLQKIVGVSHTTHIPHISHTTHIPHISHTTHIPHISHTTHIPHISITPHISHTYPFKTYPTNTYPTNTYPFNTYPTNTYPCYAYPFKRCASAGNRKRIPPIHIPPIRIFNTYPTSTGPFNAYPFKKFASAGMAMSMSIIAYHFIPLLLGGNGNEYRNLAFPSILCKIINWI